MTPTRNIADAIRGELKSDAALREEIEQHAFNAEVAALVYESRLEAGLTQQELAEMVGTQQSAIARLEDWEYDGHSLTTLKRIADVLGKRLHVEFLPRFTDVSEEFSSEAIGLAGLEWGKLLSWTPTIHTTGSASDVDETYGLVA